MKSKARNICLSICVATLVGCQAEDAIIPRKEVRKPQADELGRQMISALVDKKPAEARQFLKDGADPKTTTQNGASVLMAACLHGGHLDIVRSLVAHGADVNYASGDDGMTALYIAAEQGNLPIVRFLIEKGAGVNAGNKKVGTPLLPAVNNGHTNVVEELLQRGADVNAQNREGVTALTLAVMYKNRIGFVRKLIAAGADPRIVSNIGGLSANSLVRLQFALGLREEAEKKRVLILAGMAAPELKDAMQWPTSASELQELVKLLEEKEAELNRKTEKK